MNPATDTPASELLANLSIGTVVAIALCFTLARLALLYIKAPARAGGPSEPAPIARGLAEIFESLIIAGVLVFLIIRPFFVQAFYIPSESMENTLLGHDAGTNILTGVTHNHTVHDHIFVNKLVYRYSEPQRGSIIVFRAPKSADGEDMA
ncbi:MAG TPA: S26 family signal peptidase, partial [Chthonomonadales bacterium]|nr:S26 family signal peptidase [Chthonomonadales bacterium]